METQRSEDQRVVVDPHARAFLSLEGRAALAVAGRLTRVWEAASAGLPAYVACRHRWIDEQVQHALSQGTEQILILGAGYDTRAWRLDRQVPLVELDHPATQRRKLSRSAALPEPPDTRHIPIDFEQTAASTRLQAIGWRSAPTTVVWEGVSMYLTRQAVRDTLTDLAEICPPGSILAMDWMAHSDDPSWRGTFDRVAPQVLHLIGEPVTLAVDPLTLSAVVEPCGWAVTETVTAEALAERYALGTRPYYRPGLVSRLRRV